APLAQAVIVMKEVLFIETILSITADPPINGAFLIGAVLSNEADSLIEVDCLIMAASSHNMTACAARMMTFYVGSSTNLYRWWDVRHRTPIRLQSWWRSRNSSSPIRRRKTKRPTTRGYRCGRTPTKLCLDDRGAITTPYSFY